MPVDPQPQRDLTLTLGPIGNPRKKIPPDPPTPPHPPQNLLTNGPENLCSDLPAAKTDEDSAFALNATITQAGAPPRYTTDYNLAFKEAIAGFPPEANQEVFNSSVKLIVETLQGGPFVPREPARQVLSTADWARLSCALLAAIARGHSLLYSQTLEDSVKKDWAEAPDPDPLSPNRPTLFHRIAATADYLGDQVTSDQMDLVTWVLEVKADLRDTAAKAAQKEADEACRQWKINQINQYATAQRAQIAEEVRKRNTDYFLTVAAELGFRPPLPLPQEMPGTPRGKKRTSSGSLATPRAEPLTPGTSKAPHDMTTTRGRAANSPGLAQRWADPSPTPQPKRRAPPAPQAVLSLSPKVTLNLGPKIDRDWQG
jgi:hypothetical protein